MSCPNSKCGKELKNLDGAKNLFGAQHPVCATQVPNVTYPHNCATCHAVLPGGRCTGKINAPKSLYCAEHECLQK